MRQKIKIALCVRLTVLLMGTVLYYLLTNAFINNDDNKFDAPTSDDYASRRLLNVEDHRARDEAEMKLLAAKNYSIAEDSARLSRINFPPGLLPRGEQKTLRTVIRVLVSCYCFWMLAIICDEYFIGSIDILCQKLHLKEDVAGATFMAIATSSPELFINCVGTFITEGDIGVGTIVGSAVFNILAVPALCGLFTRTAIQLEWWSVSRDCVFYGFTVIALITVIYDNQIMWYEAACLVAAYGFYLMIMYKNDAMSEKAKLLARRVKRRLRRQPYQEVSEILPLFNREKLQVDIIGDGVKINVELSEPLVKLLESSDEDCATNPWIIPATVNLFQFLLRWPITFLLWFTIPDSRRFKQFYILTFINCVLWIGCLSYIVVFITTDVDSVMGLTFLAAGTSVPEAVSSVIVTAQGHGSMGISNSIGSNIFNILLCLGLPWLIKTLIVPTVSGQPWINLNSTGISYSTVSLLTTLSALYCAFIVNRFKLDRKIGIACLTFYLLFLIFASLVELNVFFPVHTRICDH